MKKSSPRSFFQSSCGLFLRIKKTKPRSVPVELQLGHRQSQLRSEGSRCSCQLVHVHCKHWHLPTPIGWPTLDSSVCFLYMSSENTPPSFVFLEPVRAFGFENRPKFLRNPGLLRSLYGQHANLAEHCSLQDQTRTFWDMDGSGSETWEPSAVLEKALQGWYKRVKSAGSSGQTYKPQRSALHQISKWMSCGPAM